MGYNTLQGTWSVYAHLPTQVLPSELLLLAEPSPAALAAALERALTLLHTVDPERQHRQVLCRVQSLYQAGASAYGVKSVTNGENSILAC